MEKSIEDKFVYLANLIKSSMVISMEDKEKLLVYILKNSKEIDKLIPIFEKEKQDFTENIINYLK